MAQWMTPTQAAKQCGVRPQQVYQWMKAHDIQSQEQNGKTLVALEEVQKRAQRVAKRGPGKSGVKAKGGRPIRSGDVLAWNTKTRTRVSQVDKVGENLISTTDRAIRPQIPRLNLDAWMTPESLQESLAKGEVHLVDDEAIVRMLLVQWQLTRPALASSLQAWVDANLGSNEAASV